MAKEGCSHGEDKADPYGRVGEYREKIWQVVISAGFFQSGSLQPEAIFNIRVIIA